MQDLDEIRRRVEDLTDAVQTLLDAQQPAARVELPEHPRRWADRATGDDWAELVEWVDRLNGHYSLRSDSALPPCWPAHRGVVEELASLWRAWIGSALADEAAGPGGSADLTAWHDRWLWPALRRLKEQHYDLTNCQSKGHTEPRALAPPTDLSFLPGAG